MKFVKDYSRKNSPKKVKAINFVAHVKQDLLKSYDSVYSSLLLPTDTFFLNEVSSLLVKKKKYSSMIVVGIGGSNLGALAIIEAVLGKQHLFTNSKKVFFVDTVDSDSLNNVLKICKESFLLVIISKSGRTTESAANFDVLLKKIPLSEQMDRVIVVSDAGSHLSLYAKDKGFSFLSIPKKVGGRYSVFSSVGLLPLMFAGVKVKDLLRGASDALKFFNDNSVALIGALDLYNAYLNNKIINDLFLFSNDLESLGKWFRQLMGESIGKRFLISGEEAFVGITPTVSVGSTDLHSVGQLYLGGPRNKFTSFVSIEFQSKIVVPNNKGLILENLKGLTFSEIMGAILKGTMYAYKKNNLPFNHYSLKNKSEYEIGFFMQTKMFEIMILAYLLDVNAFDQPSVEEYKSKTRKLLSKT